MPRDIRGHAVKDYGASDKGKPESSKAAAEPETQAKGDEATLAKHETMLAHHAAMHAEHKMRLDQHDGLHQHHHDRLKLIEERLGVAHKADEMRSEGQEPAKKPEAGHETEKNTGKSAAYGRKRH